MVLILTLILRTLAHLGPSYLKDSAIWTVGRGRRHTGTQLDFKWGKQEFAVGIPTLHLQSLDVLHFKTLGVIFSSR